MRQKGTARRLLASLDVLSIAQLLNARAAYAGRFDGGEARLLFVSDLAGVPQVWSVRADEDWPDLVAAPQDRAQTIHPGPRAGRLVVGTDLGGDERTQLLLVDGLAQRALTDDPRRIHRFGGWFAHGERMSFSSNARDARWFDAYVRDLDGASRLVLSHDSTNYALDASPDGRHLLVARVFSRSRQQLWLVDLEGAGEPRLLTPDQRDARYEEATWLPDGSGIVCLTDLGRDRDVPALLELAGGAIRSIVEPDVAVDSLALSPDGRRLAYALNRDGAAEIRVRELADGSERAVPGLPPGALHEYWQRGLAWDLSGERLAISWSASRFNPDVWIYETRTERARQTTRAPRSGVDPKKLAEPEHVRYPSFDGREVPALYYPPRGRDPLPPCVVVAHGGPEGQSRPVFLPVIQYLVSAGFAVLAPNVRGSTGYGNAFEHLDDVRRRMDSVADLAHGARWLARSGRADAARIAVYGGSYGGFMVLAALTTYPDLWAAGVDLVGIANFVTFLENTGPWRRHLREAEYGSLERDHDFLAEISPIHKVDRIRAPLLVVHGANDPRVPVGEAEQIVARLRDLGRPVEFVRLEDEGHQIAKLRNKLLVFPLAVDFLRRHLGAAP